MPLTCLLEEVTDSDLKEHTTYKQACANSKWILSMEEEIKALKDNRNSILIDEPVNSNVIGCQ